MFFKIYIRHDKTTCEKKYVYVYIYRIFAQEIQYLPRKKNPAVGIEPATSRSGKLRFPDNSSSAPMFVKDLEIKFCHTLYFYKNKQTLHIKRYKY